MLFLLKMEEEKAFKGFFFNLFFLARCLHLELRSGGNLRFERAQDAQIQELLTSRFRRQGQHPLIPL